MSDGSRRSRKIKGPQRSISVLPIEIELAIDVMPC
jgi:hypothetical protein